MTNTDISPIDLTAAQILMLQQSDEDIKAGRLILHEQVDKDDLKWLNEMEQKSN